MRVVSRIRTLLFLSVLIAPFRGVFAADAPLEDFRSLVRIESWTERWPNHAEVVQPREVRGEVWTDAFQAVLDQHQTLRIPARGEPYYLDAPLVLKSGCTIQAEPNAEMRLRPGTNTCMVRNENLVGFPERPVPEGLIPDADLVVEGGIWTTLATSERE